MARAQARAISLTSFAPARVYPYRILSVLDCAYICVVSGCECLRYWCIHFSLVRMEYA